MSLYELVVYVLLKELLPNDELLLLKELLLNDELLLLKELLPNGVVDVEE